MQPNRADISSKRHWWKQSQAFKPFLLFSWHQNNRCWWPFSRSCPWLCFFCRQWHPCSGFRTSLHHHPNNTPHRDRNNTKGILPLLQSLWHLFNKTLNYAGIALAVCIERSFSYFLSRLDWSVRTVRICSTCNSKAVAALRLARASQSSITAFAPPPKDRKQAAVQIDWAFITSFPTASKTLVSFTIELQRKHIISFPITSRR